MTVTHNTFEIAPKNVAIIGCGNIARRYVTGMSRFDSVRLIGVADVMHDLAVALAEEVGVLAYQSVDALLADPQVDIVVNITPPAVHAAVTIQALEAGKNVYVEKPIAATLVDAHLMVETAKTAGKLVGVAPDTFLGSAGQTARVAIDKGDIGTVLGATAFVTYSKAETWHPNPTFLFQPGGGPALDLGPYYITQLVQLLGPVDTVTGFTRIGAITRTVTAPDRKVDEIDVNVPTHGSASLRFGSGAICTLVLSFDIWDSGLPKIEIYGDKGTLSLPDPNEFDGDVRFRGHYDGDWTVLEPVFTPSGEPGGPDQFLRGPGVADLAAAIDGGPFRASADLALHVLEVLEAIQSSSDSGGNPVTITTRPERPAPSIAPSITEPVR
ncbi:Gfo/Idh/MocA family protein [Paenarthrobacter nicotinovorans]|uniref:Gfo/Idh/MocA family protein n=1 Tax=Paenarthrobacter nicotinovorans TaxID=29320 RepID=UPI0037F797B1